MIARVRVMELSSVVFPKVRGRATVDGRRREQPGNG
jgi:hypothetical protein